jgi:hypothetical protein
MRRGRAITRAALALVFIGAFGALAGGASGRGAAGALVVMVGAAVLYGRIND